MKEVNVSMSDILSIINNTVATANNVISNSDLILAIYLGFITILTVILTVVIQMYLAKDRKKHTEEIKQQFVIDLSNNDDIKEELIKLILSNPEFREKFNALIDISVNDKLNDKLKDIVDDEKIDKAVNKKIKETFMKGVENGNS
jgi:hypothetical protein